MSDVAAETGSEWSGGGTRLHRLPSDSSSLDPEKAAWVILLGVPGLGPVSFARLLVAFGSAQGVLAAASETNGAARLDEVLGDPAHLAHLADRRAGAKGPPKVGGGAETGATGAVDAETENAEAAAARVASRGELGPELAARIVEHAGRASPTLAKIRELGLSVVTLDDAEYPDRLRRVDMPPPLLFVRGSLAPLSASAAVAVVGTRTPTDRGRMIAGWIGSALARAGAVVVSGLAVGIDGAAHAAVVAESMPTVAVLGGGHARLFPRAHERLADAIVAAGGTVVAELSPDTPASRGTFPRRNRVVSGLSDATVVVEAGRHSGALITAGWALEQGRECYLVPGPLDSPASEGCHLFLRNFPGEARVVCGIPELLEDLDLVPAQGGESGRGAEDDGRRHSSPPTSVMAGAAAEAALAVLGPVERAVAARLAAGPATADELAGCCDLASGAVLSALTLLELRGLAVGSYGRYLPAGALARWHGRL